MVLFFFTLVVVALGVGVFAHYNPGTMDVTVRTYHFVGIPSWEVVAASAGVPLVLFLIHAMVASVRIRLLRGTGGEYAMGRTFDGLPSLRDPEPGPKRSWTTSVDRGRR